MLEWEWNASPTHAALVRAIQGLPCGMLVEDERGVILYGNHRLLEWSGYRVEELEGQPISA